MKKKTNEKKNSVRGVVSVTVELDNDYTLSDGRYVYSPWLATEALRLPLHVNIHAKSDKEARTALENYIYKAFNDHHIEAEDWSDEIQETC